MHFFTLVFWERLIPLLKIMLGRGKDLHLYEVLSRNQHSPRLKKKTKTIPLDFTDTKEKGFYSGFWGFWGSFFVLLHFL